MAVKPIAVEADISMEPANEDKPFTGFDIGGSWEGTLTVLTYPHLTSAGSAVAWKASAVFLYTGTITASATAGTSGPVEVELTGSSDPLAAGAALIRNGDREADTTYGNAITVSAAGPLLSD